MLKERYRLQFTMLVALAVIAPLDSLFTKLPMRGTTMKQRSSTL